jgi:hypothetical protein
MIVNQHPEGWEVIYQRAHGLLALKLACQWKKEHRPLRWEETMLAIAEHDDGQQNIEHTRYLTAAGAPATFKMMEMSMEQMYRVTGMAECKGRWIALLISKHMSFIYEGRRGNSKELDAFLDQQLENQKRWAKALKVSVAEIEHAYALMQWCDQLSLVLCQRHLPAGQRKLEVSKGPDGNTHFITQREDATLAVEPWPFEEDEFVVDVEASYLSQLQFKNDNELDAALAKAEIKALQWCFRK